MLSSRTRRRGSKSPSHSGIVTIFYISLNGLQTIRSSNSAKDMKKQAYVLRLCTLSLYTEMYGDQHVVCVKNLNCKLSLIFRSRIATTHKDFNVNRLLTLILRLLHKILDGRKTVKHFTSQLSRAQVSSAAKDSLQIAPNL